MYLTRISGAQFWVAVKELKLTYHNSETRLFTLYIPATVIQIKFLNSNPEFGVYSRVPNFRKLPRRSTAFAWAWTELLCRDFGACTVDSKMFKYGPGRIYEDSHIQTLRDTWTLWGTSAPSDGKLAPTAEPALEGPLDREGGGVGV